MQKIIFLILLFISITIVAQNKSKDYYPIKVGYEWKYKAPDKDYEEKFIVSSFDNTYDAYLVKQIIKMGDIFPITNEQLLEKRNGKVLLLGKRGGLLNTEWKLYFENIIILESDLKVGMSWKNEKSSDDIEECKVVNISEAMVAAGTFKDVLIIDKNLGYIDSKSKKEKFIIKTKEYYAPNVGLIKVELFESSNNTYNVFKELVEYKH